jgi:hypothetical protein
MYQVDQGMAVIGCQAVAYYKIRGDLDLEPGSVYFQHFLEGVFDPAWIQWFAELIEGGGVGGFETDIDISLVGTLIKDVEQPLVGPEQRICAAE